MVPRRVGMFHTASPLATVTANQRASQDFPTFGEPARRCSPWLISLSTTKGIGLVGWHIKVAPSMVSNFMILTPYIDFVFIFFIIDLQII